MSASLRCAAGNLRCSVQPGSRSNSPAAQTIAGPDPSGPPLLGAYRRGGVRIRGSVSPLRGLTAAMYLVAASADIHWASVLKGLRFGGFRHCQPVFYLKGVRTFKSTIRSFSNSAGFHRSFIPVQNCSTFSPSPIDRRLSEVFDVQIKLQRPD